MIFLFAQSLSCFIKTICPETKSSEGNLPFWLAQPIHDCLDNFGLIQFRSIQKQQTGWGSCSIQIRVLGCLVER